MPAELNLALNCGLSILDCLFGIHKRLFLVIIHFNDFFQKSMTMSFWVYKSFSGYHETMVMELVDPTSDYNDN
jgi:hypothetical protein